MAQNMDKINLENLGFTQNDCLVYGVLLSEGASPAGHIITKTDLHRNIVYTSLDHLISRKIVSSRKSGSKTIFEAITPDILVTEFEAKKVQAEELLAHYRLQTGNKNIQEISVHEGNDGYLRLLSSLIQSMPKDSTKYVLGTGGEDFMAQTMRPIWKGYHKVAKKAGIKIKMLGYSSQKGSIEPDLRGLDMYETRYIASEATNPAGIHIYPEVDTVLNIIYSTESSPVTAIRIKNKKLAAGYLNLFNNLWNSAN
jgi:sugar-specific transcriptional regulator TrmB